MKYGCVRVRDKRLQTNYKFSVSGSRLLHSYNNSGINTTTENNLWKCKNMLNKVCCFLFFRKGKAFAGLTKFIWVPYVACVSFPHETDIYECFFFFFGVHFMIVFRSLIFNIKIVHLLFFLFLYNSLMCPLNYRVL